MRLYTFSNKKCVIFGHDPTRLECEREGWLKIGATKIKVTPGDTTMLPPIVDGTYKPSFLESDGSVYEGYVTVVRNGRITPPSKEVLELLDLRCRYEELQTKMAEKFDAIDKEIKELKSIFDTNSLNFII
jgi:hypothetical protein